MIRCKFRVMSVSGGWQGATEVSLKACTASDVQYENGRRIRRENPENAAFWKYTPSGEAWFTFPGGTPVPEWAKPGQYVYIDVDLEKRGGWDVMLTMFAAGGVEVVLSQHMGNVKFAVSEEHARSSIRALLDAYLPVHRAIADAPEGASGLQGVEWSVSIVSTPEPVAIDEGAV